MLILATVEYGKARITQSWEFLEVGQNAHIVLHDANDGKIVIPLDKSLIKNMDPNMTPERLYKGTLNAVDAIRLEL